MTKITVITPTIGRESLRTMLDALLPQLEEGDQSIVIGDGPQPNARKIVQSYRNKRLTYLEYGPIRNYGNPQRNLAMRMAKGDYFFFVDDDDEPLTDCIKGIKLVAKQFPKHPLMFRMYHGPLILWTDTAVRGGNVSGQMFVAPNIPGRVGTWSGRYAADFDYINSTLALYPEGHGAIIWRPELVVKQGFAGPSKDAVEL